MDAMDSLLRVRGIRALLRGAVAASSAIFFFSLANMVSASPSPCTGQPTCWVAFAPLPTGVLPMTTTPPRCL